MIENSHRFQYLFDRYVSKNATDAERTAFLEMVADQRYRQLLEELVQKEVEKLQPNQELSREKANEIFGKIVSENPLSRGKKIIPFINRRLRVWWAAAAILFLMIFGGYLYTTRYLHNRFAEKGNIAASPMKDDVAPGHPGAILTLSDGQEIVLDSTHNGLLTKQGNTSILKSGTQISYAGSGTASGKVSYNTMTTPRGRTFQLTLSDGSQVWLNAASSITFPTEFSGSERRVEITGEVYFEINKQLAANKTKVPFTVVIHSPIGSKREVQVLGTHFNINAHDNESVIKTTLLEGSVRVTDNNRSIMIKPGEQAIMDKSAHNIKITDDVNLEQVVAWRKGFFHFKMASIETIMRQVERWYDVDVVYKSAPPSGHYNGEVSMNLNASEMLKVLELSGIRFKIENKKIIVL